MMKKDLSINAVYIAASCNRVPHCLSLKSNTLLYGACNAILVSKVSTDDSESIQSLQTLVKHSDRVNCVRWISEQHFVSTSTDKTAVLWKNFSCEAVLRGHTGSVTCADGISDNLVVTASADSSMRIWRPKNDKDKSSWECAQVG